MPHRRAARRPTRYALAAAALLCGTPCFAQVSMGVSRDPDSKARFVWPGEARVMAKNPDTQMMLKLQNGGAGYGTNVTSSGVNITFARSDLAQIRWCAYLATEAERDQAKTCKPEKSLKPDAVIRLP